MPTKSVDYSNPLDLLKADHYVRYAINFSYGSVSFNLWHRSELRTPLWIQHGHGLLGDIDPALVLDATRLYEVHEWITPQLHAVFASYESKWDGKNKRGHVDEEALQGLTAVMDEALATIDLRLLNDCAGLCEAEVWFDPAIGCERYGISETSSDEELAAIAKSIEIDAALEYVVLTGLDEYLVTLRSSLQLCAASDWCSK